MKFTAARGFSHTRVGGRLGHTAHAIGPLASACWWGDEFSLAAPWRPGRERGLPHILAGLAGGACAGAAGGGLPAADRADRGGRGARAGGAGPWRACRGLP